MRYEGCSMRLEIADRKFESIKQIKEIISLN